MRRRNAHKDGTPREHSSQFVLGLAGRNPVAGIDQDYPVNLQRIHDFVIDSHSSCMRATRSPTALVVIDPAVCCIAGQRRPTLQTASRSWLLVLARELDSPHLLKHAPGAKTPGTISCKAPSERNR